MSNSEHVSTEMLADYAEGLLRESEASAVAEHLAECAECRAEELLLASLSEILAADDVGPMPAVYAARIDAALADVARTSPVGSGSAGTDPVAGSFHPEGAYATTGALDLTPSALAASSGAASAEVIDLAARRKVVAQGLSRVTTVAASIVLLIGGTVLGLQALNSGDENTLDSPNEFAQNQVQPFARETIQPSPIRNSRVPIYVGAKKNPDGSYTNPNGVVVRPDGSAVLLNGKVLKPQKKSSGDTAPEPAGDPTLVVGPQPADSRVTSKSGGSGPMVAADKDKDAQDDARPADVTVDPADPTINPATPEPDEGAGAPAGGGETAEPAPDSAKALRARPARRTRPPSSPPPVRTSRSPARSTRPTTSRRRSSPCSTGPATARVRSATRRSTATRASRPRRFLPPRARSRTRPSTRRRASTRPPPHRRRRRWPTASRRRAPPATRSSAACCAAPASSAARRSPATPVSGRAKR
jgi:hypothetical protein